MLLPPLQSQVAEGGGDRVGRAREGGGRGEGERGVPGVVSYHTAREYLSK